MTIRIRRSLRGCLLLVLLLGIMGAGNCDLAMQIWAGLQEQIDSQQQQIDQLTEAVCGLPVLTDSPTLPLFCAPPQKDGDPGPGASGGCPAECGQLGCFQCGSSLCCNNDGCGANCL